MPDTIFKRSPAVDPARLEHIQGLLSRYPQVSDAETEEILRYLKKGPALDTALLTTVEPIRPRLARFREDHRRHFAIGVKEYAVVVTLVIALVALLAFLWDSGLR